jgi:hypothetical protein
LSAGRQLVLTDEQLTLLAVAAGAPCFPGARCRDLDAAAWTEVAHSLVARGLIHDGSSAAVHLPDAVLAIALFADRALWITITHPPHSADPAREILWFKEHLRVRQSVTPVGFHTFSTAEIDEVLDEVLAFPTAAAQAHTATGWTLTEDDLARLLAGASRVVSVQATRRVNDDRFEGVGLTLVDSTQHGLLLIDEKAGEAPVAEPVTATAARERVTALAQTVR